MTKYYIGIDIGGTMIKGGILDDSGKLVMKDTLPTEAALGNERFLGNVEKIIERLIENARVDKAEVVGIGMGIPGMIDSEKGEIVFSANLFAKHLPIRNYIEKSIGLPVRITNDANAACLGEVKFGGFGEVKDAVMITLGTGVGGGIIANGVLLEGNKGAGAEIGHSLLVMDGELCTCGRKGCVEAYVSASALIRDTKKALERNPRSKMWEKIKNIEEADAKLCFDFEDSDETAKTLVENYVKYLGEALVSFGNIFRPSVIILGGGVANQGENLTKRLQKYIDENIFALEMGPKINVEVAAKKNDAGTFGAAALFM